MSTEERAIRISPPESCMLWKKLVWEEALIDQKEKESIATDMPLGTTIHNIEITLRKGVSLARAAGAIAKLIAKDGKSVTLKLPSGKSR